MAHPLNSMLYAQYQAFRLTDIDNLSYVTWLERRLSYFIAWNTGTDLEEQPSTKEPSNV